MRKKCISFTYTEDEKESKRKDERRKKTRKGVKLQCTHFKE